MRDTFETSGDVREVDLLAAFCAFWRDRTNGAVSFSRGGASAAFQIADGVVVGVSSTEPRFESSAILIRAGKLDATAIERLSVPEGTDGALAALQAGILTRREWRWGEKIRAIEVLADLLGWTDGKYYFDAEARPETAEFTLTIPRLVLELFLRSRDRNLIEHQLGPSDAPIVRGADFEKEFSTFGLTADAESVVRLIDGRATADEIARAAPADDFAVRKLLAALTTLGLVHTEGRAEEPPAVSPPPPHAAPPIQPARELDFPAVLEVVTEPPRESEADAADFERASEPASAGGGEDEESAATRAIETPAMEQPAWEMPELRRPRGTSSGAVKLPKLPKLPTPGFELDPPGSVTPLEAYPLPAADRQELRGTEGEDESTIHPPEADLPERGGAFEPLPPAADAELYPDDGGGGGGPRPPRGGFGAVLAWVLGGLVVLVAAVVFIRSRTATTIGSSTTATTVAEAPTLAPTAVVVPSPVPTAAAVAVPTIAPTAPAPARATAPTRAAARPTARPAPTKVPKVETAPRETVSSAASEKVPGSRSEWLARAARDQKRLAGEPSVRYSIQLELACEVPSLAEAWKHDQPAGSMWVLTTRHGPKDCFRVLWGRYPSLDAAKAAKSSAPAFFTTSANHPAVVSVR